MSQGTAVWITGVGAVTPLGNTYQTIADGFLEGRSGVRLVTGFDVSDHPSQIAGLVNDIGCPLDMNPAEFSGLHRLEQVILSCSSAALVNAAYWESREELRVGVVLGLGAEWLEVWEADGLQGGNRVYDPALNTTSMVREICRRLRLSGPALSISAACASGNYALAQARRWLELGWVDICLAGACDMGVTPMSLAGFGNLRALSRRNDEPQAASRPFDKGRDGFVMGEGGAVFVLEPETRARRRGISPYAEVAGFGASSDAHNMVIPSPDPEPATAAMRQALADAGIEPAEIDYINAHATSTPRGDAAEAKVLEAVLGDAIHAVPVSSTKSMTGHLLTAAAAVEALACLIAIERSALPPTINLLEPDPECDLCHVANQARSQKVRVAVSNSFGFGGSNTCLVLKAV
ncbi:MAG TPA: beta-ketoacyl-[acyl-carrier-protein] synthase family protein [Gemmataceae bacterium]|nr:beta-ketoacyl-[acyl-carrier-protein] synthase family protein [Gemmataceae bacterium]